VSCFCNTAVALVRCLQWLPLESSIAQIIAGRQLISGAREVARRFAEKQLKTGQICYTALSIIHYWGLWQSGM
jgi:hypothetical protein